MSETTLPFHRDPEIMGGALVLVGTRVPVQTLLEYLEAGDPLDELLTDFPNDFAGSSPDLTFRRSRMRAGLAAATATCSARWPVRGSPTW